ncbi:MAG: MiaB/RimO family radical SAM methylthiotransferase [Vicinamibacterales bacterium]|nr:MiaB/RimO family radical SAM methylthiotransferase [Vicinamibacterales bacterium]
MKTFALVTFGCRVNQADSLAIEAGLIARGAAPVPADRADLVVVNTCSVTASADQGARQTIRRIHRDNPGARIVTTGCYATRAPEQLALLPGVAAVLNNADKGNADSGTVPLLEALEKRGLAPSSSAGDGPCGRAIEPGTMGRTAWTLRVQTGCEERCSYCIIPSTRGASRSRTPDDVLAEVRRIEDAGYREVAITGVHLGSYGRDVSPATSLEALLTRLVRETSSMLFRVSSLEPMDCPTGLIDLACAHPTRIAPHFHLPLQHASNAVLARMRRPYTLEQYSALVDDLRARLPHAAIGSDVIVGFPGETDAEFDALASYLERAPLTHLHVFPYSDRPGTVAEGLPDKVHGATVKARAQRIRVISRRLQDRFRASLVGTTRPALAIEDGGVAVTDNYIRVPLPPGHERNDRVVVVL